ncbi:MAG: hypothetical protein M8364_12845 [Methylobacter sp.]|uniref:hypothetical protein n=1 Tax=Methylobacter sp. TaxID=2051955 RepID=UPI00258C4D61|nr:hypothetical protein [Methylobacter sp.]MCL7421783.1 hypothetical protein [Methylobacter sp.]
MNYTILLFNIVNEMELIMLNNEEKQEIHSNAFTIIENANKLHVINKNRRISEKTRLSYNRIAERLLLINKIMPINAASSKSSYYVYKAAVNSYLLDKISATILLMNKLRAFEAEWLKEVSNLKLYIEFINAVGIDQGKVNLLAYKTVSFNSEWSIKTKEFKPKAISSKSKRLKSLPKNWTEKIFLTALESKSKHILPIATLAITGCRPQELEYGVELKLNDDRSISAKIFGAKTHDGKYGQAFRMFTSKSDSIEFLYLIDQLEQNSGILTVKANAGALCDKVPYLSKKTMPRLKEPVSAYCYRHRFSGDLHKVGLDSEAIAKALGHSNDQSQQKYSKSHRSGATGFSISNIVAATPVNLKNQAKLRNSIHDLAQP